MSPGSDRFRNFCFLFLRYKRAVGFLFNDFQSAILTGGSILVPTFKPSYKNKGDLHEKLYKCIFKFTKIHYQVKF